MTSGIRRVANGITVDMSSMVKPKKPPIGKMELELPRFDGRVGA